MIANKRRPVVAGWAACVTPLLPPVWAASPLDVQGQPPLQKSAPRQQLISMLLVFVACVMTAHGARLVSAATEQSLMELSKAT